MAFFQFTSSVKFVSLTMHSLYPSRWPVGVVFLAWYCVVLLNFMFKLKILFQSFPSERVAIGVCACAVQAASAQKERERSVLKMCERASSRAQAQIVISLSRL